MFKGSLELAGINKIMELKFNLIIKNDEDIKSSFNKVIQKFSFNGNEYFKVNPRPYLTIDISKGKDKTEGWSSSHSVNLNRHNLFMFNIKLKDFINKYSEIKNLFYYDDINGERKLVVNREEMVKVALTHKSTNKTIRMVPCVVPSDESECIFYEGCVFAINDYSNFCYLTYDEMQYLSYELEKVDLTSLSMQLLSMVQEYENAEKEEIKMEPITEQKEEEKSSIYVPIESPNTIPDL